MKQEKLKKKVGSLLLAVAMIAASFPAFSTEVHAAEPDTSQFVTKDQLKNFDTNDTSGSNPAAKVYFGNNNQKWWIAGSQSADSLVLFAASPLTTDNRPFEPDRYNNKQYSADWECTYSNETPTEVYPNHYGASPLRATLQALESSYFTSVEQALMNNTTVYTDDSKNTSTSVYSTTDKLYLAYGGQDLNADTTVGLNSSSSLNGGLKVDRIYWGNSAFWLRTPRNYDDSSHNSDYSLFAQPATGRIGSYNVDRSYAVVPAFELNLSSVSFASTAPPASSDGTLTTAANEFTMRHAPTASIGTASISKSKESVAVTGAKENTYLVVQNSDGAWAKKVASTDVVFAEEVSMNGTERLTSFENCKVWLETTGEDRITYATEATSGTSEGKNIKVNAGQNMTITNNIQIDVAGAIQEIKVKASDGYRFPENYGSGLTLKGLTLTRVSATEMKLSETPSTDTYIQLPDIAAIPKAATPEVSVTPTTSSITLAVTNYDTKFGAIQYSTDGGTNWQTASVQDNKFTITGLHSSTSLTISVKYMGNNTDYAESDSATVNTSTSPASYTITIPATATADGSKNEIKVDGTQTFDLGQGEQVSVKIKDTGAITNGKLTLIRENDPTNQTVTSALTVDGKAFTDLTKDVALFASQDATPVNLTFAAPPETNIAAGTYKGTVTFEMSLVQ